MIQCQLSNGFRVVMKLNEDKCHFLLSGYRHEMMLAKIGQSKIWEKEKQKLLGATIDRHLKLEEHIVKQCKKARQKLSALARVCNILNQEGRRTLTKAFIESEFGYCPLIWMFCERNMNNRMNHLHERSLRIVYNNQRNSFQELLELDNSVSIDHRNICLLAIELFEVKNGLSNQIMSALFNLRNIEYILRSKTDFSLGAVYTTNYGLRSLRYFRSYFEKKILDTWWLFW